VILTLAVFLVGEKFSLRVLFGAMFLVELSDFPAFEPLPR
jgi:hypothetical protein